MTENEMRIALFEKDLKGAFQLISLKIDDESHLHAGHVGAAQVGIFELRLLPKSLKV